MLQSAGAALGFVPFVLDDRRRLGAGRTGSASRPISSAAAPGSTRVVMAAAVHTTDVSVSSTPLRIGAVRSDTIGKDRTTRRSTIDSVLLMPLATVSSP